MVIAAVIALIGVYLQTMKTLKAERERLDDQLSAERERLQMQLGHDRETKEREDLRQVLDSAAIALDDIAIAAIDATSACEDVIEQEPSAAVPEEVEGGLTELRRSSSQNWNYCSPASAK